jgi:hypothetical protein
MRKSNRRAITAFETIARCGLARIADESGLRIQSAGRVRALDQRAGDVSAVTADPAAVLHDALCAKAPYLRTDYPIETGSFCKIGRKEMSR